MPEINITCKGSKYMPLDQLKNFQGNLKTLPESELEKLKRSILKHGFSFPVFIWNDSILDGHQRTFAVRNLIKEGYTIDPIPVVEIMASTKSEAAEKLLILNSHYAKITEDGLFEFLSANELDIHDIAGDLNLPDFDMDNFMSEYMETEEDPQGLTDEDEIPELPEEAITRPGDLICLGKNLLLCGDATHEVDVKRLMGKYRADMCFTSPPYNVGRTPNGKNGTVNESKYGRSSDNLEQEDYVSFLYSFITLALSFGDNVFCNIQSVAGNKVGLIELLYKMKDRYADTIIWDKMVAEPAMGPNVLNSQFEYIHIFSHKANRAVGAKPFRGTLPNIFQFNSRQDKAYSDIHKATFPVAFAHYFVSNFASDLVYEPFGGTGSTLIACEKAKLRCFMMELDPHYCDVIVKRWEDYTGEKSERKDA